MFGFRLKNLLVKQKLWNRSPVFTTPSEIEWSRHRYFKEYDATDICNKMIIKFPLKYYCEKTHLLHASQIENDQVLRYKKIQLKRLNNLRAEWPLISEADDAWCCGRVSYIGQAAGRHELGQRGQGADLHRQAQAAHRSPGQVTDSNKP